MPIVKDKVFFFGGYQGRIVQKQSERPRVSYVPTQAMLNGDFTAVYSRRVQRRPAAVALRAPFVDNKIIPVGNSVRCR